MALNPPRRPRGAAVGAEALYVRIAPEAMATLTDAATRCGVSKADFVEALALHLRESIDERGVPTWWNRPLREELDLAAS